MNLNHKTRLGFARDTLEGLSIGDTFGEALSYQYHRACELYDFSALRSGTIRFTDDTAMAIGIIECLKLCKTIDEDALTWIFAKNFRADPQRSYGKMARRILTQIGEGSSWRSLSMSAFGGGSFSNGSAMRVGPVGAYFSDDLEKVREMASASARVTHSHPEGIAGAIAIAIATAIVTSSRLLQHAQAAEVIWVQEEVCPEI